MSANTLQITPFMHVKDCEAAVRFFVDVLGFTPLVSSGGYAYVEREGAGLRILGHENDDEAVPSSHGGFAYYIDVRNIETVLQELGPNLARLPEGQVKGPVDQPYGQRELMIRAPDGNVLVFGQAIDSP